MIQKNRFYFQENEYLQINELQYEKDDISTIIIYQKTK